ncbi:MAG: glycoside hydrolase family 3 C-terminal domain-containing protein [Gemmatimonadaceae bacterium]|nr:glycoside hydrolase family 3 C-terminal domain-containing protein [Gemmatimonadaceae bacterium]
MSSPTKEATAPYRDADLPVEIRVADLLSRMTLAEKAAQMMCVWNEKAQKLVDASGAFDPEKARAAFGHGNGLGQVGRPSDAGGGIGPRASAELTNAIQRFFIEESRLGIPVVFHEECLHGQASRGATSFPQPIGLAATFNPALVEKLYAMTAHEARVRGTHLALTPVVDVARDARWGRVEETFGEDTFLVSTMGQSAVRGFQGDASFRDHTRVMATLKHFAAHGQPESGQNCAPVNVSERVLRETFLAPFEDAIRKAGAIGVMASYNEIDGVPSHASKWLLRDVLRDEWQFQGFVVSDYYAIWELGYRPDTHGHFVAHDRKESAALSIKAGVNIELPEPDCYLHIEELVREGTLREVDLDALVAPMLYWKFRMGLFDHPYVSLDEAERVAEQPSHRALALDAARETITLLKNDGDVLPLDVAALKTIAVVGPNAHRAMLGGYSGTPTYQTSILDGIREFVGDRARVVHAEGCRITEGGSWQQDEVVKADPADNQRLIEEAVRVAADADVIVLAVGGNEQTSREAWSRVHLGDRTDLELVGEQNDLLRALTATGKPVVAVLINGRPLAAVALHEEARAILECWYLGQEGGRAVAEVLFGAFNPGGKLPISVPRHVGQLPIFYNYKPSARRGYLFDDTTPLYPFGFGLSYTSFALTNARVAASEISRDGHTTVQVDVTNTGTRAGTEVVQLYIRDVVSSVTRPVKELKGFAKVHLKPGETTTVTLPVTPESLWFYNIDMERVVEPGEFHLLVGTSSQDADLTRLTLRVTA